MKEFKKKLPLTILLLLIFNLVPNHAIAKTKDSRKIKIINTESQAKKISKLYQLKNIHDNKITDKSRWIGIKKDNQPLILDITLAQQEKISGVHFFNGYGNKDAITDFHFEFKDNTGKFIKIPSANFTNNKDTALAIAFDTTLNIETQKLRLVVTKTPKNLVRVKELIIWRENGENIPQLPKYSQKLESQKNIFVNQSGYNINKPKLFTVPNIADGTPFSILNTETKKIVFTGNIKDKKGDFSQFNPKNSSKENTYIVKIKNYSSVPFGIGHWWIERISYQNSINFMIDGRHRFGTYKKPCRGSFGWRDDHHFGWELNTLVPQLLANPEAFKRMPKTIKYQSIAKFNGILNPYNNDAPDIVKLIHFGADIIVTQKLKHEFLKEQLAYFLYAYPYIKEWIPQQNYDIVKDYALKTWSDKKSDRQYPYDNSKNHDLFALKTIIGTTKGNNPPGHSVLPNLLMYEVLMKDNQQKLANKFFSSAYNQVDWMIKNIDWNDPLTTKGQRMSEHITMTGLALMLKDYPKKAPKGLKQKIKDWQKVVLKRSQNMWDFRKYSPTKWVPNGKKRTMWNEPGNVAGVPAIILASINSSYKSEDNQDLNVVAYSHLDNIFGRNPTGRHYSYHAPQEIPGVEYGWYSYHKGGIGKLEDARFVLDGSPKNEHYPFHPEVGNVGWSEGWIQHNNPLNLSLAYMAYNDTQFSSKLSVDKQYLEIQLQVPLNFNYIKRENVKIDIFYKDGSKRQLTLVENNADSAFFSKKVKITEIPKIARFSYGHGYFSKFIIPTI